MSTSTVVVRAGLAGIIVASGLLTAGTSLAAAQPSAASAPETATSSPSAIPPVAHVIEVPAGNYSLQSGKAINLDGFQCPADHPYLQPHDYTWPRANIPLGVEYRTDPTIVTVNIYPSNVTYKDDKPSGWIHSDDERAWAYNYGLPEYLTIIAHCQDLKPA